MSPDATNKGSGYAADTAYTVSGGFVTVTLTAGLLATAPSCIWSTA